MWVVLFDDNLRHSAWLTRKQASEQARVLEKSGIIRQDKRKRPLEEHVVFDSTVVCADGHYYV